MTRKLNMTVCWANCPLLNKIKWEKKEEIMMKKNNTQTEIHRNFLLTIHWHVKSSQCMFNHIQKPPHFYNLPQFVWKYLIYIYLSLKRHIIQRFKTRNTISVYEWWLLLWLLVIAFTTTLPFCVRYITLYRCSCCYYSFFIHFLCVVYVQFRYNMTLN